MLHRGQGADDLELVLVLLAEAGGAAEGGAVEVLDVLNEVAVHGATAKRLEEAVAVRGGAGKAGAGAAGEEDTLGVEKGGDGVGSGDGKGVFRTVEFFANPVARDWKEKSAH